jgi:ribosomal protein L40E
VRELCARRDELAERVAELHWDLGGMTYEMAIRDHFRLDVLVRHAAVLQEVDAELGEVERLLAMEETATTGTCRSCGAVHSRGAVYCWKCGQPLMLQVTPSAAPAP